MSGVHVGVSGVQVGRSGVQVGVSGVQLGRSGVVLVGVIPDTASRTSEDECKWY